MIVVYYSLALLEASRPAELLCPVIEMMLDYETLFWFSIFTKLLVIDFKYFRSSIKNMKNIHSSLTNQIVYIFAC